MFIRRYYVIGAMATRPRGWLNLIFYHTELVCLETLWLEHCIAHHRFCGILSHTTMLQMAEA